MRHNLRFSFCPEQTIVACFLLNDELGEINSSIHYLCWSLLSIYLLLVSYIWSDRYLDIRRSTELPDRSESTPLIN
jgi:hypothetical protein